MSKLCKDCSVQKNLQVYGCTYIDFKNPRDNYSADRGQRKIEQEAAAVKAAPFPFRVSHYFFWLPVHVYISI